MNHFLKYLCNGLGYQSNLKGCTNCNNKNNLVSFDIESGGFICANCFDATRYEKMSVSFLKEVYNFLTKDELYELSEIHSIKLLSLYTKFLKDVVGLNTSSYEFILKCL